MPPAVLAPQDRSFLKAFFQAVTDQALEPDDPRYVPLYEGDAALPDDPVELLARAIEFSEEQSVQLLSGFRGIGKTTELLRLQARLRREGYKVMYIDMLGFVNTAAPIDVTDFLMALGGAVGESLKAPELLGENPARRGYWDRLVDFLIKTNINVGDMTAAGLKVNLRSDPSFLEQIQKRMQGHLGALVTDVWKFVAECVAALKQRHGHETQVVLLIDSLEKMRGSYQNARQVQESVETLFAHHAEKLRLPDVHVVYTVPPYLKARSLGIGMLYGLGAVPVFPAIKVRGSKGDLHPSGLSAMRKVVEKRGDWARLLGRQELVDRLILMSGGNLRDLLRLFAEVIRRAKTLPVSEEVVEMAINQMRAEFLPIANTDASWLATIAATHEAALMNMEQVPDLARFFDSHVVLCYRNGPEWYDVHPLIREHVIKQAEALKTRSEDDE
ncbi:MAG: hypothetical protein U0441_29020 [Polyangiaceae bacterium]